MSKSPASLIGLTNPNHNPLSKAIIVRTVVRKLTLPDGGWFKVELPVDADNQVTIDALSQLMTQYGSFELSALPDTDAAVIKHAQTNPLMHSQAYIVVDRKTGQQVGKTYQSRVAASRRVDVLDNAYGAYRYAVRCI